MDANTFLLAVEPIFDSFQRATATRRRAKTFLQDRVTQVYHLVHEFAAQHPDNQDELWSCVADVLLHFLDCTLVVESKGTQEAVDAVWQLLAAVAAQRCDLAQPLLQHTTLASTVLLERVRATACRFVGVQVLSLRNAVTGNHSEKDNNDPLTTEERDQLLDMASQALIPRITDKAQSVRLACIQAAASFFTTIDICQSDDPEIRQALQWSVQHDPSVANRVAALQALPVTVQTSDGILSRLRDVKPKVRQAALEKLIDLKLDQWDAVQCTAVVEAAHNDRCATTQDKAMELICKGWMKDVEYNPIRLLDHIGIVEHEETCETLIRLLLGVDRQKLLAWLGSKRNCTMYWHEMDVAGAGLVSAGKHRVPELARLVFLRVRCQYQLETTKNKEALANDKVDVSALLPDVPSLCELLELNAMALLKVIVEEETVVQQSEDEMVCVCLNVLQLLDLVELEEGARMHLQATMTRLLASITMPEDLVEGCTKALRRVVNREDVFWNVATEIVESLESDDDDTGEEKDDDEEKEELTEARQMRILSFLSTVCETSSAQLANHSDTTRGFYNMVSPFLSHHNPLIREAAVGCLGRLGMFANDGEMNEMYATIMTKLASNNDEPMEIRIQAIFALADWVLILSPAPTECLLACLLSVIPDLLQHPDHSVVCIIAEVAMKLLFSRKVQQSTWVGTLVVLFFDPRLGSDSEESNSHQVGDPVRLEQLLSVFFPSYCLLTSDTREAFVGCVSTVLEHCRKKDRQKRKRGTKAVPVVKMMDFVLETAYVSLGKESEGERDENSKEKASISPSLQMAVQLAAFLLQTQQDVSVALLRNLCKQLGKLNIEVKSSNALQQLRVLADLMEQLGTELSDPTSLKAVKNLCTELSEVDFDNALDDEEEEGESESLAEGMERLHLDSETEASPPCNDSPSAAEKENQGTKKIATKTNKAKRGERPRRSSLGSVRSNA